MSNNLKANVNVKFTPEMASQLKAVCFENATTPSQILRFYATKYIKDNCTTAGSSKK